MADNFLYRKQQLKLPKLLRKVSFGHTGGSTQGHLIPGDLASEFIYNHKPLYVSSSNVDVVSYDLERGELTVYYLGDGGYLYFGVSEQEAISLAQARSKGRWVWSHLRVRGSKTAHKKPFRRL